MDILKRSQLHTMTKKIVTGACNIRGDDCLDYLEARGENGKTISTKQWGVFGNAKYQSVKKCPHIEFIDRSKEY